MKPAQSLKSVDDNFPLKSLLYAHGMQYHEKNIKTENTDIGLSFFWVFLNGHSIALFLFFLMPLSANLFRPVISLFNTKLIFKCFTDSHIPYVKVH